MLNCLIIDDEPLAQEILSGYLNESGLARLAGTFSNAFEAQQFLKNNTADVLFLDIEMPEMNGIDFLKSLSNPPITVFTTAFRNYAFEGFELGVIDFLLKPISRDRFLLALEKISEFLTLKTESAGLEANRDSPDFIFVKSGVQKIKLYFKEVSHIQGLKDYAIIHTIDQRIVIKGSVKFMQGLFPASHFIRVHRSFIVAKDKIKWIETNRIIIGEHQIPIGRNYKTELEKKIQGDRSPF